MMINIDPGISLRHFRVMTLWSHSNDITCRCNYLFERHCVYDYGRQGHACMCERGVRVFVCARTYVCLCVGFCLSSVCICTFLLYKYPRQHLLLTNVLKHVQENDAHSPICWTEHSCLGSQGNTCAYCSVAGWRLCAGRGWQSHLLPPQHKANWQAEAGRFTGTDLLRSLGRILWWVDMVSTEDSLASLVYMTAQPDLIQHEGFCLMWVNKVDQTRPLLDTIPDIVHQHDFWHIYFCSTTNTVPLM